MPERKYHRKIYQKNKAGRIFFFLKLISFCFLFSVFCFLLLFVYYAKDLPRPENFLERPFTQSTRIYDKTGKILLYEIYGEEKRKVVSLNEVPEYLKQAAIVAEDKNFYQHFGVDFKGIARSILINLKIMEPAYGGSTIPQQLVRSSFLTRKKTAERKIREIILASSSETFLIIAGTSFNPACPAALNLRSPAIISYWLPFGLTIIGLKIPCSLIDSASSEIVCS